MEKEEVKRLIIADSDFIYAKKYDNSLKEFLENYPKAISDKLAATVLCLTSEEYEIKYQEIVKKGKQFFKTESIDA